MNGNEKLSYCAPKLDNNKHAESEQQRRLSTGLNLSSDNPVHSYVTPLGKAFLASSSID